MAGRKRRAEGRFNKFIGDQNPAEGQLPLVHITRAYAFDEMLDSDELKASHCDVFGESLIYMFYGRPAYRAKDGNNARLEFEWPIVFVFDPNKIMRVKRVFPFDSGAFALGLYAEFFDRRSELNDFALDPSIESARKVVGAFYRDHDEYYHGNTRKNVDIPLREFEAQGVHELARLPGVQSANLPGKLRDDRSSAIEVQTGEPISFRDALIAVILPEPYLDDKEILGALGRWRVNEIHTYATLHNLGGEAWVGEIYAVVLRLYRRLGFLK